MRSAEACQVVDHPGSAAFAAPRNGPAQFPQSTGSADHVARGGGHQQEALKGAQLVVCPVLLAKADKRRELDEHQPAQYTLLAYT